VRSPLADELDDGAEQGTRDAVEVATRRRPRVRATALPESVPAIDGRAAGRERALADMRWTHGFLFEEET
jgi:hypothetical protein